jgi:L-serine/L-threonine ammonia-lyase
MVTDVNAPPAASHAAGNKKPWRHTPLIESAKLSKEAGCRIFLKLENLQPSGSFKSRGLGNQVLKALLKAPNPSRTHFYCSSGGNAGLACVAAANFAGRPSTVVVPLSTKPHMIEKIKALGATDVLQHGVHFKEADRYLKEVVMAEAKSRGEDPIYCHPYDDPDVWEGHSSLVDEIDEQMAQAGEEAIDAIVCSVGGGGLFNGIMEGIARQGTRWDKTQVVALETHGADSLAIALDKDEWATLPGITSIATSLGAVRVSSRTFELAREGRRTGRVRNMVLSDAEAAMGCWRLADEERMLVEPACGVNVALCYGNRLKKALGRPLRLEDVAVIVVCGGSNVSTDMINAWREEYSSEV